MQNTKDEIKAYLTENNIGFNDSMTKSELLALIPEN